MSEAMTNDAVKRLTHLGQRERVSGRAVENKIDRAIRFKNLPNAVINFRGDLVLTIGGGGSFICFRQSRECFRTHPGGIVAGKLIAPPLLAHLPSAKRHQLNRQPRTGTKTELPDGHAPNGLY